MRLVVRVVLIALAAAGPATAQTALFAPASVAEADLTARQAEILRLLRAERGVTAVEVVVADPSALDGAGAVAFPAPGAGPLVLDGAPAARRADGGVSWAGRVATPGPAPLATTGLFVARGGFVTGVAREGGVAYTIRPLTGGLHAVARVETAERSAHGDDYAAFEQAERARAARGGQPWPLDAPPAPAPAGGAAAAAVTTVDVLVPYTAEVAAAYADPVALAQLSVDTANETYGRSGINVRLALVAAYPTPTAAGTSINADLAALQNPSDGRFDEVHARRNAYGADLVALLGADYAGYCGLGYVNASASFAFSVTAYTCAGSDFSFAHEVGHNFGSSHDPYVTASPAYPYGHGMVDLAGRWRTVMAYNNQCAAAGFTCPTVGYWSSPAVTYTDPTDPVHSGPTGDAAVRDNVRLHNERAATVAAFRATAAAPVFAVTPGAVRVTLPPNDAATVAVTVRNAAGAGARPLDVRAYVVGGNDECTGPTDVAQEVADYYGISTAGGAEFGQSFTAPCTGLLRTVAPEVYAPGAPSEAWAGTMRVHAGAGTAGTVLGSRTASGTTPAAGYVPLAFPLDTPVPVQQGAVYTWFLDLASGRLPLLYAVTNPYAGGTRFRAGDGVPASAVAQPNDESTFALRFDAPERWATLAAATASANAGGTADLTLGVGSGRLAAGTYALRLVLTTNDPATPTAEVPLTLTVSGALPVELAAFTARTDGPAVRLAWATASETNNAGFAVEMRAAEGATTRGGPPGDPWREVAFVEGHGTAAERHDYAHTVAGLVPGRYAFRLRQTDTDGAAHLSPEVEAEVGVGGAVYLAADPSPARGPVRVRVAVPTAQAARVEVFDVLGRRVATLADGPLGANRTATFTLGAGALPAGTYVVRVVGEGVRAARTFVVAR